MEKRKTQKAAFPAFPQGPLPETERGERPGRTHTKKEGGLSTAIIDHEPRPDHAVSNCRDPAVLVDAGQQDLPDSPARASDRSASKHLMIRRRRFHTPAQRDGLSLRTVSRLRPPGLGFAIGLQARQHIQPNRVPLVRTGRSPSVALHPVSPRRSYGRLWSMSV
jgi:hypothetical protein